MDKRLAEFLQRIASQEWQSRAVCQDPAGQPRFWNLVETASGHLGRVALWLGPRLDGEGSNPDELVAVIELLGPFAVNADELPAESRYGMVPASEIKLVHPE
jgi:hypothetical protein